MRVYELPFAKYPLAAPILQQTWFDEAYIDMVLEGIQPGRIFVDRLERPSAALLCHQYEFYVAGDAGAGNSLRQFIRDNPAEPNVFHTLYGYGPIGSAWETALLEDAGGRLHTIARRNFRFRRPAPLLDWRNQIPSAVTIRQIDAELAVQVDRVFHNTISQYWSTHQRFLEHSYGFCALIDGEIASLVDVSGISSKYANFGIETVKAYRGRGYATLVCTACIEHTLASRRIPTWDCDAVNVASAGLAHKLGFDEETPFSQLSPEKGYTLPLTHGRWSQGEVTNGIIMWIKQE